MDYEKKYKEALERMKSWVRGEHPECFTEAKKAAEFIFPELKESEDEKIRKAILALVRQSSEVLDKQNQNNMIAWLENQAEYKSDEVEPKFKPGDWISGYYTNYKVLSLNNDGYVVEDVDGDKINILFENEKFHHLFTITDAKDGDVLAFYCEYKGNKMVQVGIIEKYVGKHGGCSNTFKIYVGVDWENNLKIGEYMGCPDIRPATKEQRDTLMKAITNAGYIFNFESKELRKIEKPIEWSYEDEANLNNIIWLCNNCIKGTETTWIPSQAAKIKHLIETIKEKGLAQQNPAWSEEDEQIILSIEQVMNCASLLNIVPEKMDKIRTWLKSLKDRCTWKPSDKQMDALQYVYRNCNPLPSDKLGWDSIKTIELMYQELKKLREE